MIDSMYEPGFRPNVGISDHRIQKDDKGYFAISLSEGTKVYLHDYYTFLETTYNRAAQELEVTKNKLGHIV
mgnify:FL=1